MKKRIVLIIPFLFLTSCYNASAHKDDNDIINVENLTDVINGLKDIVYPVFEMNNKHLFSYLENGETKEFYHYDLTINLNDENFGVYSFGEHYINKDEKTTINSLTSIIHDDGVVTTKEKEKESIEQTGAEFVKEYKDTDFIYSMATNCYASTYEKSKKTYKLYVEIDTNIHVYKSYYIERINTISFPEDYSRINVETVTSIGGGVTVNFTFYNKNLRNSYFALCGQ